MKTKEVMGKKGKSFLIVLRGFFILLVLYILLALEVVWPRKLSVFGVTPNMTLTFLILFSLRQKGLFSLVISAIAGLFLDVLSGKAIPIDSFLYVYISFWCVWVQKRMYIEDFKRYAVAVFAFSFLKRLSESVFFMLFASGDGCSVSELFFSGIANVLSIVFLGPFVSAFTKKRRQNGEKED